MEHFNMKFFLETLFKPFGHRHVIKSGSSHRLIHIIIYIEELSE